MHRFGLEMRQQLFVGQPVLCPNLLGELTVLVQMT